MCFAVTCRRCTESFGVNQWLTQFWRFHQSGTCCRLFSAGSVLLSLPRFGQVHMETAFKDYRNQLLMPFLLVILIWWIVQWSVSVEMLLTAVKLYTQNCSSQTTYSGHSVLTVVLFDWPCSLLLIVCNKNITILHHWWYHNAVYILISVKIIGQYTLFSARYNIYISRLCCLSVCDRSGLAHYS